MSPGEGLVRLTAHEAEHLMAFKCVPFTEQLLYGDLYKQPRE